jgi:hypothetical protein
MTIFRIRRRQLRRQALRLHPKLGTHLMGGKFLRSKDSVPPTGIATIGIAGGLVIAGWTRIKALANQPGGVGRGLGKVVVVVVVVTAGLGVGTLNRDNHSIGGPLGSPLTNRQRSIRIRHGAVTAR